MITPCSFSVCIGLVVGYGSWFFRFFFMLAVLTAALDYFTVVAERRAETDVLEGGSYGLQRQSFALQKAVSCTLKDGLLEPERPPFGKPFVGGENCKRMPWKSYGL